MNPETSAVQSTPREQVLTDSFPSLSITEGNHEHSWLLSEGLRIEQLHALRLQLIRKNRLLADLKRQLLHAQNILTQLQCMADPGVAATVQIHQQITDSSISFIDCAKGAMQELDSSSERMSYLIKQLKRDAFSTLI